MKEEQTCNSVLFSAAFKIPCAINSARSTTVESLVVCSVKWLLEFEALTIPVIKASPTHGSFLLTPIPGERGPEPDVTWPICCLIPSEASIAIIYGLEIVSYIKSIVLPRFWACTGEASVPNTGRLFFFYISRWPVTGPRQSPVARSEPIHKNTIFWFWL